MAISISKKLILSFLGLTLLVLIATLGLARWSFEHGFLDYVNAVEETRLQLLATSMSRKYENSDKTWSTMTEQDFKEMQWELSPKRRHKGVDQTRPPPPHGRPKPGPPPGPPHDRSESGPAPGPPRDRPISGPPPGPPHGRPKLGPPTALFDLNDQIIVGRLLPREVIKPISVPIMVDGKRVGILKSAPRRHFESPQETAFSKQQWITSLFIGFASLLLATLVAWLLTGKLLAPIRRMINGVSQLSNGDYSIRFNEPNNDELCQLMGNLDQLAFKLEENRNSRRRWLADISHELRTPTTILTGEIESMKDGICPIDMQQILSLDQEITRLRLLIDDLYELSLSDIGGLRYSFYPVDILDCINTAVALTQNRAKDSGIILSVSGSAGKKVNGDEQRLSQLFSNLIENSLAYTNSPGKIEISLSGMEQEIVITLQDTPPGVKQDEYSKLFDPLYRLEGSRSRHTAGAGLGLAICKNIVDAHQGKISASASHLGGLSINIVLPLIT